MRYVFRNLLAGIASFVVLAHGALAEDVVTGNTPFRDPLVTPAGRLHGAMRASQQPILTLARVEASGVHRMVAAGLRGLILVSDDDGKTWRQAQVPVQSDLTALSFVSARQGWAVGHDGVILHTADGGEHWVKQFDGNLANGVLTSAYRNRIAAGEKQLQPFLDEVVLNTKDGATLPFLGVYFENERTGYAVGSFGMLVETEDGGKTWNPWLDHIDNPGFLNLNDIREVGGQIYIAGEQGKVYRLDQQKQRFVSVSPAYKGSLFHITGNDRFLLAIGLGGTAFRSTDAGQTWEPVATGVRASLTSAALSHGGHVVVVVTVGGQVLYSADDALTFKAMQVDRPMMFADVVAGRDNQFVLAGYNGIETEVLGRVDNAAPVQK
ncbi:Glycosyl hydrolase [Paraburkholderia sacchari]